MTNIILQPASGREPRGHYRDTVDKPVSLSRIRDHLASDAYESLSTAVGYSSEYVPQGVNILTSAKARAAVTLLNEANTRPIASKRQFGSLLNHQVGNLFTSRMELSRAGVHRPTQAGISGSKTDGADSIVLNGGYVDDEDFGDAIVYTGHGGQDGGNRQVRDQELTDSGN